MHAELVLRNFHPDNLPKEIAKEFDLAKFSVTDNIDNDKDGVYLFHVCFESHDGQINFFYDTCLEELEYFAGCLKLLTKNIRKSRKSK